VFARHGVASGGQIFKLENSQGVNEMPIQKRRRDPGNFEQVAERLQAAASDAVAVLHASLFDASPSTRIRAAEVILNLGTVSAEIEDLESCLSKIEGSRWTKARPG
jgi:hypothetical protein